MALQGRRQALVRIARLVSRIAPQWKMPIATYLDWEALVDPVEPSRAVESHLAREGYLKDPDFDRWYPIPAILSLIDTPPPAPLSQLTLPTMFLVPIRGWSGSVYVDYLRDLYGRLPVVSKKMTEVDGSAYWMLSHPVEAAGEISSWFRLTL